MATSIRLTGPFELHGRKNKGIEKTHDSDRNKSVKQRIVKYKNDSNRNKSVKQRIVKHKNDRLIEP
jgi:hypothetical protein